MQKIEQAIEELVVARLRHFLNYFNGALEHHISVNDMFDYEKNSENMLKKNPAFRLPAIYNTKLFQTLEKLLSTHSIFIYKSLTPFLQCPPNIHISVDFYTNTNLIISIDNCFPIDDSIATILLFTKDDPQLLFQFYIDYNGTKSSIPFAWNIVPQWSVREDTLLRETVQKTIPYISPQIYLNYLMLQDDTVFNSILTHIKQSKEQIDNLEIYLDISSVIIIMCLVVVIVQNM